MTLESTQTKNVEKKLNQHQFNIFILGTFRGQKSILIKGFYKIVLYLLLKNPKTKLLKGVKSKNMPFLVVKLILNIFLINISRFANMS